jgi:hypothetical protein
MSPDFNVADSREDLAEEHSTKAVPGLIRDHG